MNWPTNPGRTIWSAEEDTKLRALQAEGKTPCAIAKELGRRESSVYRRIEKLTAKPTVQQRPCMCCGRVFASDGPHNRLCSTCRTRPHSPYAP